jgi:hypothetical protein
MKRLIQATAASSLLAFAVAQQDPAETAFVRVAHLSPNAPAVDVELGGGGLFGNDGAAADAEALSNIEYRDVTDYVAVPAGDYDVVVSTEGGAFQENLNFAAGGYYTIAAMGLVGPGGLDQTEAPDDGGFLGFGGTGDVLGFRLEVLEEDVTTLTALQPADPAAQPIDPATGQATDPETGQPVDPVTGQPVDPATGAADPAAQPADPAATTGTVADPALQQLVTVRLVHAAPGVAQVSLVNVGAAADGTVDEAAATDDVDVLISNVPFGDVSNYNDLDPAQTAGLELRIEESPAAAISLADSQLDVNTVYTMFVIGTPLEAEPLEVLLVGTTLQGEQEQDDERQDQQQQDQQEQDQQGQDGVQDQQDQQDNQDNQN